MIAKDRICSWEAQPVFEIFSWVSLNQDIPNSHCNFLLKRDTVQHVSVEQRNGLAI